MTDELDQLAYSIAHFAKAVDLSETTVRNAIDRNELIPVYPGVKKGLITRAEGLRWLESLPTERPGT